MKGCPYCDELADLLKESNIKYKIIDIDKHKDLFEAVIKSTGFDHVPQVLVNEWDGKTFHNGKYVSDFDTLEEAVEQVRGVLN